MVDSAMSKCKKCKGRGYRGGYCLDCGEKMPERPEPSYCIDCRDLVDILQDKDRLNDEFIIDNFLAVLN